MVQKCFCFSKEKYWAVATTSNTQTTSAWLIYRIFGKNRACFFFTVLAVNTVSVCVKTWLLKSIFAQNRGIRRLLAMSWAIIYSIFNFTIIFSFVYFLFRFFYLIQKLTLLIILVFEFLSKPRFLSRFVRSWLAVWFTK